MCNIALEQAPRKTCRLSVRIRTARIIKCLVAGYWIRLRQLRTELIATIFPVFFQIV